MLSELQEGAFVSKEVLYNLARNRAGPILRP